MKSPKEDAIAIIGMSCAFPKATDLDQFWQNLQQGKECVTHFHEDPSVEPSLLNSTKPQQRIPARGILADIEYFDPDFFGFSPQEAAIIDPQQRLFLQKCVEALEVAGCDWQCYEGKIGVFASAADSTYLSENLLKNSKFLQQHFPYRTKIMTGSGFLATRVSYQLNFKGPSINISTACSSSLVGLIYACKALQDRDCDLSIAGGVTIQCPQDRAPLYKKGGVLSPDGKCRPFDKKAEGTVSANGLGIVVLKRLDEAIRKHDPIFAIIKGYAINNDGADKVGYTAPSVAQQALCIQTALKKANVSPEQISYIETHGTATPLGDSIEIAALRNVFSSVSKKEKCCALGAVKSNIGHTDMAAGIASVIKTVLSLNSQLLVPTLHHQEANPTLKLEVTPFYLNTQTCHWKLHPDQEKRIAGVNALGIGGTNAHLIVEEWKAKQSQPPQKPYYCVLLSARSDLLLQQFRLELQNTLQSQPCSIAEVAYTLAVGRSSQTHRTVYIASDVDQLCRQLREKKSITLINQQTPHLIFILNGGSDLKLSQEKFLLLREVPFLQKPIDDCLIHLPPSLIKQGQETMRLYQWITEYAYIKSLLALGVVPHAYMMTTGWGELIALVLAKKITLKEFILSFVSLISNKNPREGWSPEDLLQNWKDCRKSLTFIEDQPLLFEMNEYKSSKENLYLLAIALDLKKQDTWKKNWLKQSQLFTANQNDFGAELENKSGWSILLSSLSFCWVNGFRVDWHHFFKEEHITKVKLPTRKFMKKKLWIDPSIDMNKPMVNLGAERNSLDRLFAVPYWELYNVIPSAKLPLQHHWLFFSDGSVFCQKMIAYLYQQKQKVIILEQTQEPSYSKTISCFFDPMSKNACQQAKEYIHRYCDSIDCIFYYWAYNADGLQSIFILKNVITEVLPTEKTRNGILYLLVKNSMSVVSTDLIQPENAAFIGIDRVVSQEYPLKTCVIDLEFQSSPLSKVIVDCVQLCQTQVHTVRLAYRQSCWFLQQCKRWQSGNQIELISKQCTVVVTGGLGKIGLVIAEHFAKNYQANLLLIAHSIPDTSLQKQQLYSLTDCHHCFSSPIQSFFNRIKLFAHSITIAFGDVASYQDLEKIVTQFIAKYRTIDFIFHLAAALSKSAKYLFSEINSEAFLQQWRPKVVGLKNIYELSQHYSIKKGIVFSSLASWIGGFSMAAYSGVSTALDGFFHSIPSDGTQWVCLNWDGWQFEDIEKPAQGFTVALGIQCLENILSKKYQVNQQILLAPSDIIARIMESQMQSNNPSHSITDETAAGKSISKSVLKEIFNQALGREVDEQADYYELGGDSLLGVELLNQIEKTFKVKLNPSIIFQYRTIHDLYSVLTKIEVEKKKYTIYPINQQQYPPIFLIPPLSGLNACYIDLANNLNGVFTCYAIRDPEIEGQEIIFSSVKEMAEHYLKLINSIQREGSYILIGYSFGGTVAHAITRSLEEEGKQNICLFIIDGWATFSSELYDYKRFELAIEKHVKKIQASHNNDFRKQTLIRLLWHRMQLMAQFEPRIIKSPIILMKAGKILSEYQAINDRMNHWQRYTFGSVQVKLINENHDSILNVEGAQVISDFAKEILCQKTT